MNRVRNLARTVSGFFSGVVGVGAVLVLSLLGVLGTILTATDILHLTIDPAVALYPAAIVVGINVIWQVLPYRGGGPMIVVVQDDDGKDVWGGHRPRPHRGRPD